MGLIEDLHTTAMRWRTQLKGTQQPRPRRPQTVLCSAILAARLGCLPADADCTFDVLKQGRVAAILDMRTFRLADGQEVRLAGIELPDASPTLPGDTSALERLLANQDVVLRG